MKKKYIVSFVYGGDTVDEYTLVESDNESARKKAVEEFNECLQVFVDEVT